MAALRRNYTNCHRFKMLTRWLTFTAFLAGSASPERVAFTVAPTCRVKGHPEAELTLNCGDGKSAGVVQYWHTPFGDLQTPDSHNELEPVFMHYDGSLVVPNTSSLHSGLYYCLLQHAEGTTLWPYELHVSQNTQGPSKHEQRSSCGAFRFRRDVGSEAESEQGGVSDGQFAGAVAASVVLTFVLGFSTGALTRTHVLRCLGAVTTRLRSPRKRRCQTDRPNHGSEVTMTTLPPMCDNQAFEMEQAWDDNSANCASADTTISSTTSSPPAKPQRSFRNKRQEQQETTAYLEGCDHMKEEERRMEEVEERNKGCDGEREFCLSGEDGGSQTETDEDECSEEGEERDGKERREEKTEWSQEKEVEEAGEQENRSKDEGEGGGESEDEVGRSKEEGGEEKREEEEKREWRQEKEVVEEGEQNRSNEEGRREGDEEAGGNKEKGGDEKEADRWREEKEGDDGEKRRGEEDGETDSEDETGSQKQDSGIIEEGAAASSAPRRGRRSRVIRLYQYDDDGQRYCHLPHPAPNEPGPAPKLKQRSLSLTRLNAIMAAASAGPLDTRETRKEETEERPHFHMEI